MISGFEPQPLSPKTPHIANRQNKNEALLKSPVRELTTAELSTKVIKENILLLDTEVN